MGKKDNNKQGKLSLENSEQTENPTQTRIEEARKKSMQAQAQAQAEKEAKQKEEEERKAKAEAEKEAKKKAKEERKAQAQAEYDAALESAQNTVQGQLAQKALSKAGIGGVFEETPEQKKKREAGRAEREASQEKDLQSAKTTTEQIVSDAREISESDVEKNIASLENLVNERISGMKNDPIYNELPKTIRQAYKAKEFGEPMNEEIRKAYREELRKPKKERNNEVIDAYKKELERTKGARQARDWYTLNAIGTGLMNVGTALKGGTPTAQTEWNKRQGARLEAAQQRYKDLLDAKADTLIEEVKNKQGYDQATQKAIRGLYNDKRLQPILNKLDTNSQIQLVDLMQDKAGAINFNAFINALVLQMMKDPEGAVSKALGLGEKAIDFVK